MFSGATDGTLLPLYVVHKSENLWSTRCSSGPPGTRYNRTRQAWFDSNCFVIWFKTVILPHCQKYDSPKVLIGDKLSSQLNLEIIELCNKLNIRFVFLPANSTHLTQPLNVAFFCPLLAAWRMILTDYRLKIRRKNFPYLLNDLVKQIGMKNNQNLKKGFNTWGIIPMIAQKS